MNVIYLPKKDRKKFNLLLYKQLPFYNSQIIQKTKIWGREGRLDFTKEKKKILLQQQTRTFLMVA